MISAAISAKSTHHAVDVDAGSLFSFLLLRFFWGGERFLGPEDEPFVSGSRSRLSSIDCASAESEPGGGRYPNAFCSSDWSLRASSGVRVFMLMVLSALQVRAGYIEAEWKPDQMVKMRTRNDVNKKLHT
jgi:hypothetical protein